MMELENLMMEGILLLPPQGMLGQLKKTWHKKFCQLFKPSKVGIKRIEIFDSQEEASAQPHSAKIITLEACVKITPSHQPHVFTVVTKTNSHDFGCSSEFEMSNWIRAFQTVAFEDTLSPQTIEEDNDLYCTSGEGVFAVKLVETDASKKCGLQEKNYTLIIAAVTMKLMDCDNVLFTWPYRFIRRYGYRDGKFTFEAGRKCKSGEGSFSLEHNNQQEIFRCVSTKMKSMKKFLSGDSNPNIEFNDAQYHAALSMEAGSRSPLPPSPNSSGNLADIDFSTISQNSQKQLSNSSSVDSMLFIKPPPPIIKPKPAKPPRKTNIFSTVSERKLFYESPECPESNVCGKYARLTCTNDNGSQELLLPAIKSNGNNDILIEQQKNPYDSVEVRNDAWKTHGVDNIPHTEIVSSNTFGGLGEAEYETMEDVSFASQNSNKSKTSVSDLMQITPTSPIIHNNIANRSAADPPNYDKLQHFGSTHKLNHNNSGYRTPNVNISHLHSNSNSNGTIAGTTTSTTTITTSILPTIISGISSSDSPQSCSSSSSQWDDYELVEDMKAVRLAADDSSHGYGMIRKKLASPQNVPGPNHKIYNETEYAVISKPKRV